MHRDWKEGTDPEAEGGRPPLCFSAPSVTLWRRQPA